MTFDLDLGNPGLSSYYEDFMARLYQDLGEKVSVWAVSHFGHDFPKDPVLAREIPSLSDNRDLFTLKGQTQHKVDFIKEYVPKDTKVTLVGHSIGCRMILDALHALDEEGHAGVRMVKRAYMLFPTIERMYASPNGPIHWHLVRKILQDEFWYPIFPVGRFAPAKGIFDGI